MASKHRINYLDGMRGLAILSVVIFHAYGSWPQWLPFGDKFIVAPFRFGFVGVELFFLISGFVIMMTLDRCETLTDFAVRRWLRLFPAMLACSLIIFVYDKAIGSGPLSDRTAADLLPGIAFVSPSLLHALTGLNLQSMDGQFWSLYVEMCFYAVIGVAFFALGRRASIALVLTIFAGTLALRWIAYHGTLTKLAEAADWIGLTWFGWFSAGIFFYLYEIKRRMEYAVAAILLGLLAAFTTQNATVQFDHQLAMASTVFIFFATLQSKRLQAVLAMPFLLFLGGISYPLYLVHNNIMIGFERDVARYFNIPDVVVPLIPIAIVCGLAWSVVNLVERPLARGRRRLKVAPIAIPEPRPSDETDPTQLRSVSSPSIPQIPSIVPGSSN